MSLKHFFTESGSISLTFSPLFPIMAGSDVDLICSISLPSGVTGSPEFEWDGPLTSTDLSSSEEQLIFSQLTLGDIAPSDAGPYTCTATLGGSVSTTINISVEGNNEVFQLLVLVSCILYSLQFKPPLHQSYTLLYRLELQVT